MIDFTKYTGNGQKVMQASRALAENEKAEWGVRHVAIALFEQSSGYAADVLKSIGLDAQQVTQCLQQIREQTQNSYSYILGRTFQTPELKKFLQKAECEAQGDVIGSGDLLLALTDPQYAPGIAPILASFGITKEAVEKALADIPKP